MASSRLVAFEEIKRNWLKHEDRLIHIKSTLNTRRPISKIPTNRKPNFSHSLQVELENKALLKKLTERAPSKQDISICTPNINPLPKSNRKKYYQEYRIKCENEGMYKRLKRTKPIIDNQALRIQRSETEKLLNTISKFGYKNLKPTKTFVKFEMANNQLKYLSKRKILLQRLKSDDAQENISKCEPNRIIEKELQKQKKNEKIFNYLSRCRKTKIDSQQVFLKIISGSSSILVTIRKFSDKQNSDEQVEVKIPQNLFKEKYQGDLQELVMKLKYDQKIRNFYIL